MGFYFYPLVIVSVRMVSFGGAPWKERGCDRPDDPDVSKCQGYPDQNYQVNHVLADQRGFLGFAESSRDRSNFSNLRSVLLYTARTGKIEQIPEKVSAIVNSCNNEKGKSIAFWRS